jgi:hypothetical protein
LAFNEQNINTTAANSIASIARVCHWAKDDLKIQSASLAFFVCSRLARRKHLFAVSRRFQNDQIFIQLFNEFILVHIIQI